MPPPGAKCSLPLCVLHSDGHVVSTGHGFLITHHMNRMIMNFELKCQAVNIQQYQGAQRLRGSESVLLEVSLRQVMSDIHINFVMSLPNPHLIRKRNRENSRYPCQTKQATGPGVMQYISSLFLVVITLSRFNLYTCMHVHTHGRASST